MGTRTCCCYAWILLPVVVVTLLLLMGSAWTYNSFVIQQTNWTEIGDGAKFLVVGGGVSLPLLIAQILCISGLICRDRRKARQKKKEVYVPLVVNKEGEGGTDDDVVQ